MISTRTAPAALGALLLLVPASSHAQRPGQFQWQLQPFCNVVSLNVTQNGAIYARTKAQ